MKLIPLTRGLNACIDDEDYELVIKYRWRAKKRGNTWYAESTQFGGSMHRLVMSAKKGQRVDHRDGFGLNNQKYNLRIATPGQNSWNRAKHKRSSSKYKGVSWSRERRKWEVWICRDYKKIKIGFFEDEIEAAKAYDSKAKELFGEFAFLNFP